MRFQSKFNCKFRNLNAASILDVSVFVFFISSVCSVAGLSGLLLLSRISFNLPNTQYHLPPASSVRLQGIPLSNGINVFLPNDTNFVTVSWLCLQSVR